MSKKEEKAKEPKAKKPLKDVTGKELSDEALKNVSGGMRRNECTCTANTPSSDYSNPG